MDCFAARRVLLMLVVVGLVACRTAPIVERDPIPVPNGLSPRLVKLAILSGITQRAPTPEMIVVGSAAELAIWQAFMKPSATEGWHPEAAEDGRIYAGYYHRAHYLRVVIDYDTRLVQLRIVDSRNLDQAEGRIHENALVWMDRLEDQIRQQLGRVSVVSGMATSP